MDKIAIILTPILILVALGLSGGLYFNNKPDHHHYHTSGLLKNKRKYEFPDDTNWDEIVSEHKSFKPVTRKEVREHTQRLKMHDKTNTKGGNKMKTLRKAFRYDKSKNRKLKRI